MANDVTHGHYAFHEKAIASNIADHKSPQAYRYRANSFKKALREDTTVKNWDYRNYNFGTLSWFKFSEVLHRFAWCIKLP